MKLCVYSFPMRRPRPKQLRRLNAASPTIRQSEKKCDLRQDLIEARTSVNK